MRLEVRGMKERKEEEGTTEQCKAILGLLDDLIYDWLGALDGRRGHVNGRQCVCVRSCKTRC